MLNSSFNYSRYLHCLLAIASAYVLAGCAWNQLTEEDKSIRLFLAPGSLGITLLMPQEGFQFDGINTRLDTSRLRSAARRGDTEEVSRLMNSGGRLNGRDSDGWSALTLAAEAGHYQTCARILEFRSNNTELPPVSRVIKDEALTIAVQKGNRELVGLLLVHGASPNSANDRRQSVLMRAAQTGDSEVMEMLIKAGADVHAKDIDGHTVHYWMNQSACARCIELLEIRREK